MTTKHTNPAPGIIGVALAMASPAARGEQRSLEEIIREIKNPDDLVRGPAWQQAAPFRAAAVRPLAKLMNDTDKETP